MTPEELAAHKAKVEARKTPKTSDAEKVAIASAVGSLPSAPAPVAAPPAAAAASDDSDEVEFKSFELDGQKYQRLASSSGWASGDLWYTKKDGSRGDYLGELLEDGSINGDAKEPELN